MDNICGIYKISSIKKPNRIYIGSACNYISRKSCHLANLKKGKHHSRKLQNHVNKYGVDDLLFAILLECGKDELIDREQSFIDLYNPYFNICSNAFSCLGVKRSEETRRRLSKSLKGVNKGRPGYWRDKKLSPETKEKISKAHMGKSINETTREKLKGRQSPNKGKKASPELRARLSAAHRGIKQTEESKQKRSKKLKGRIPWNVGIPCAEETKAKQRAKLKNKTWEQIYGIEGANKRREDIKKTWTLKKQ